MLDRIEPGSYFNAFQEAGKKQGESQKKEKSERSERARSSRSKTTGSADRAASRSFGEFIASQTVELEKAHEQLDAIHSFGERLKRDPNLSNLQEYRRLVQEFLNDVVSGAYALDRQESGRNILKRKRFTLVSRVNQKLDRLAVGLMQTQTEQLDLLARIDEINGLLVNLVQ
ncbi:MAG: YaaR family protein [Spirochaetales bacterium]